MANNKELLLSLEGVYTSLVSERKQIEEELKLLGEDITLQAQMLIDRMEVASDSALSEDVNAVIAESEEESALRKKISDEHKKIFQTILSFIKPMEEKGLEDE